MSADIWRHLGIPETADETEIRRAYAERLKRTNPEDDAEGFKRLRAAYERALANARWKGRNQGIVFRDESGAVIHANVAPNDAEKAPASELPPADEVLSEHLLTRRALEKAVHDNASSWEVLAAFRSFFTSAAMERVGVFAQAEAWMANLLHRYGGAGELLDRAILDFKWETQGRSSYAGLGAQMLMLRESRIQQSSANAFLARVRDKRHEFHGALADTEVPFDQRTWLWKLLSFGRMDLVRRFLDYLEEKAPYAEDELDYESVYWWRKRINFWISPLVYVGWFVRAAFVIGAFVVIANLPSTGSSQDVLAPRPEIYALRRGCASGAAAFVADARVCESALQHAPDSLSLRQMAAMIELRSGQYEQARTHFDAITSASPADPVARYGSGLALYNGGESAEREQAMALMGEALSLDPAIRTYFAAQGISTPSEVTAAAGFEPFPIVDMPEYDTPPSNIMITGPNAFDDAYAHFGIEDAFDSGRVVVQCLARTSGRLTDCQIVEETPRNSARGEMALYLMASATVTPARFNAEMVDAVPVRAPFSFRLE